MLIPSISETFTTMTNKSPSESAAFLQLIREKTGALIKDSIESGMLDPQKFQIALNKAIGTDANGIINNEGKIDFSKLDELMGGNY